MLPGRFPVYGITALAVLEGTLSTPEASTLTT